MHLGFPLDAVYFVWNQMERIQYSILDKLPTLAHTDDRLIELQSLHLCVNARLQYFLCDTSHDYILPHAMAVDKVAWSPFGMLYVMLRMKVQVLLKNAVVHIQFLLPIQHVD